ncbi:MAG: isoleucine--tRNA ligase [Saprospiraceae bacterium]|nr:isoleucine--tRNA ligase [Saprospiraceae bacterium]
MSYSTYKKLDLPSIDKQISDYWHENNVFKQSIDPNRGPSFVFYEGPPSANGKPGIHHVIGRTVKDLFCRYQTMKGKSVLRKGGWDTHGLPVELAVEKELGITKEDIGKSISVAEYNAQCRQTVMRYKDIWDDLTRKMGYWVDLENPYITFENSYIETVWFLLKRLYDKGYLYKGYTIQPYSPAAGTGLSSHELNMPGAYRDVKDISAVAQFKAVRNEQSNHIYQDLAPDADVHFLAWTTTPWTLPSNTALAVGKKVIYVRVATFNPYTRQKVNLILAKDLLGRWFSVEQAEKNLADYQPDDKVIPYKVTAQFTGAELEGIRYEQLLPFAQPSDGDAFRVLLGDFVTTEDGTGIVHLAPSFGADDMRVAKKHGIGSLTLVDTQGKFTEDAGLYAGRYVKNYRDDPAYVNVDIDITVQLKKENKAFNVQKYSHSYPHCWRTDKPVLYYPLDSWFIKSTDAKERMVELNKQINWKPKHTGEKRFGHWLENLQDWNLSRSRFWGIPLPIWRTSDGEEEVCIGSIEELATCIEQANVALGLSQEVPDDLHRPYMDDLILLSPTGRKMFREQDLIDVWFDSGSMPYAQWHYPFENKEVFMRNFPADFIAEGVDQTRGWFFTLHAIAVMAFDSVAFKNVVSNGVVQDKDGRKMSKRWGNAVEPFETIAKYGADATRWYLVSNAQPWDNLKFDVAGISEVQRKFFGTLYNTYSFFSLYANIDKFIYQEPDMKSADRPEIDRWIISLLQELISEVDAEFAQYEPTNAARKIQEFVGDHLSNWYVRLCRRRFWKGDYSEDKISAYQTLYTCLVTVAKLSAPIAPFFADWLYKNLNDVTGQEAVESVHLSLFPGAKVDLRDEALEQRMTYAQKISSLVLSLRKKESIRVRQPLKRILLPILDDSYQAQVDAVEDLILSEVNVKQIEYIKDTGGLIKKNIKPNFKTLGKRLGKQMKQAAVVIGSFDQEQIAQIEEAEGYELHLDGEAIDLTLEDFIISSEDIPGWQVANEGSITVALDTTLDDQLVAEGTARELVNRIQNLRKSKDFEVTDRIIINLQQHDAIQPAIDHYGAYIRAEVLANEINLVDDVQGEMVELFEGIELAVDLEKSTV